MDNSAEGVNKTASLIGDAVNLSGNLKSGFLKHRPIIQMLLADPETYATVILVICLGMYGTDIFKVDQLTVLKWLQDDFHVMLPEENENKLNAALAICTTNYFYNDIDVFSNVCATLAGGDAQLLQMEPLTIPEVLWGIYEVSLITSNAVIENTDFSQPILDLITATLSNEADENYFDISGTAEDDSAFITFILSSNTTDLKLQLVQLLSCGDKNSDEDFKINFPVFQLDV